MTSLILTILCTTAIGVIVKLSETRITNRLNMLFANYVTATVMSAIAFHQSSGILILSKPSLLLAPIAGVIFALNFFLYIEAIKKRGVALPVSLMRLSAIVPVIASILIFGEHASTVRAFGIAGALAAAVMISLGVKGGEMKLNFETENKISLVISSLSLLICFGLADLSMKVFETFGQSGEKPLFLAVLFACAGVSVLAVCVKNRIRPNIIDYLWGIFLGIPNLFASYFLIGALNRLPGTIVFPTVAAVSVMLIALIAVFAFGEKLGKIGVCGIGLTIISLIAVNI